MRFIVSDRRSIEEGVLVRSSYVVISIHDPDKTKAHVRRQAGLRDTLYLAFHDAEPCANIFLPKQIKIMTEAQARLAWEFVRKWDGKVGVVVVHCEQGMSRSPAVAAALCVGCGGDDSSFFRNHQPNPFVYRLMLACKPTWKEGER